MFNKTVSNLSEDSYDYVFGGRRKTPPAIVIPTTANNSIKLTSPPIRLRPEGELKKQTKVRFTKIGLLK